MSTENGSIRPEPTRRAVLSALGAGAVGAGLAPRLALGGVVRAPRARVKHVIFLTMTGGPSQVDLFDHKPELSRRDGTTATHEQRRGKQVESLLLGTKREFARHGETGQWCSSAFRHLPAHMDKLAVVKSLYTDSFVHASAMLTWNTGQTLQGHPSMGAWVDYALGSESPDLPGFVVMQDPRGGPIAGPANWSSGYLPPEHQGVLLRTRGPAVLDLQPAVGTERATWTTELDRAQLRLMERLNERHASDRTDVDALNARAASFAMAQRMRTSIPEALDLSGESEETKALYGFHEPDPTHELALPASVFGRQCLIARRLVERGVRFVQVFHGGGHQQQTWDGHLNADVNLDIHCPEVDRPFAGLLEDLERTGLLDETLVVWGGEFGRMPVCQQPAAGQVQSRAGRGHNPKCNTVLLAGGGVRPGSYGATDELGFEAVEDRHHVRDLHATILHLLGLDHETLTYYHGGLDRRLTGVVEAQVIDGILA